MGRGSYDRVRDMRRSDLVIGCGDLDLCASITSDRSGGGGVESVEGGNQSDDRVSRLRPGDRTTT